MPYQINEGEWQADLCDCCSSSHCCLACWCPCLVVQKTQTWLENPADAKPSGTGTTCLAYMALQYTVGLGCLVEWGQRRAIRKKFGITSGSKCTDCAIPCLCPCCAVIQEYNELEKRREAGVIDQKYHGQAPMQMGR